MSGLISADDVFDALFAGEYVDKFDWKDISLETVRYNRSFFCKKCRIQGCHTFEILVQDGKHYIDSISVRNFIVKHGMDI